jgi:hypothetical protein
MKSKQKLDNSDNPSGPDAYRALIGAKTSRETIMAINEIL